MANKKAKKVEIDPNAGAFRIPLAARYSSLGERTIENLISSGRLRSGKVGRCRVVRRADLDEFLARQVATS